jgi:hypothetical protein
MMTGKPYFARRPNTTAKEITIQKRSPKSGVNSDITLFQSKVMKHTTIANRAAPSISAATIIIDIRISLVDSGWRAIASIALAPIFPIPRLAPITASPAPMGAARDPKFVAA